MRIVLLGLLLAECISLTTRETIWQADSSDNSNALETQSIGLIFDHDNGRGNLEEITDGKEKTQKENKRKQQFLSRSARRNLAQEPTSTQLNRTPQNTQASMPKPKKKAPIIVIVKAKRNNPVPLPADSPPPTVTSSPNIITSSASTPSTPTSTNVVNLPVQQMVSQQNTVETTPQTPGPVQKRQLPDPSQIIAPAEPVGKFIKSEPESNPLIIKNAEIAEVIKPTLRMSQGNSKTVERTQQKDSLASTVLKPSTQVPIGPIIAQTTPRLIASVPLTIGSVLPTPKSTPIASPDPVAVPTTRTTPILPIIQTAPTIPAAPIARATPMTPTPIQATPTIPVSSSPRSTPAPATPTQLPSIPQVISPVKQPAPQPIRKSQQPTPPPQPLPIPTQILTSSVPIKPPAPTTPIQPPTNQAPLNNAQPKTPGLISHERIVLMQNVPTTSRIYYETSLTTRGNLRTVKKNSFIMNDAGKKTYIANETTVSKIDVNIPESYQLEASINRTIPFSDYIKDHTTFTNWAGLCQSIYNQINLVRTDPKAYSRFIQEQLDTFEDEFTFKLGPHTTASVEGKDAWREAINYLMTQAPMSALRRVKCLDQSAAWFLKDASSNNILGHVDSNKNTPTERMKKQCKIGSGGQNIAYGMMSARAAIIQLIVDDDVPDRGHRLNIFKNFTQIGLACGPFPDYGTATIHNFLY